jgi:hypothetical protein
MRRVTWRRVPGNADEESNVDEESKVDEESNVEEEIEQMRRMT